MYIFKVSFTELYTIIQKWKLILEFYKEKISYKEIAEIFSRSKSMIYYIIKNGIIQKILQMKSIKVIRKT